MSVQQVPVQQPQRWDAPFDPGMREQQVDQLLAIEPFACMDADSFSRRISLRGILKNDCRIATYQPGDIVIRQGDYGNSAFLILSGRLLVTLANLPADILGRQRVKRKSLLGSISQLWKNSHVAEARSQVRPDEGRVRTRNHGEDTRVFIQDIPGTINLNETRVLNKGMLFGELAALTRTPRSATVIASEKAVLLEMRWQGFRDLMKRDEALRDYVDRLYREHSLGGHLRQTPELAGLPDAILRQLADQTTFQSLGDFDWTRTFKQQSREDIARRIQQEPLIAEEDAPATDFIMIRNGFVRLSRQHGDGHRTIAYMGKGQTFGLREIAHNWRCEDHRGYSMSLRAVGHVDILRIPASVIAELVLPNLNASRLPPPFEPQKSLDETIVTERRREQREPEIETSLLEFLVEGRFINGTEAMLIDLDRCTRCDDCVRACAATHDNNPRFLRQGPSHENWMIASACMHCVDPVCMIGCPTGAIGRDESTGNVVINDLTCIGCGTCANSCPYSNIRMVDVRDPKGKLLVDRATGRQLQKATKCDFCVEQNGGPACQRACPHDALYRVNLTTPSTLYQLTAE